MSASRKGGGGFNPPEPRLTMEEFQSMATFFKQLLAENPLIKISIIVAGIGGGLEAIHILWLCWRFVFRI